MILLSFLGTGNYQPTCYTWQDQQFETKYVIQALAEFFPVEEVKVFVTTESLNSHGENLEKILGHRLKLTPILIPSGTKEEDIWELFDKVVESVEPNNEIIFDITHAFRSIPLIVLLASAFLEKARNVKIKGVYYGQFNQEAKTAPVFDLTPAITLLDWLTATDKFINTGSAQQLSNLLSQIQNDFYKQGRAREGIQRPQNLAKFAKIINNISQSIEFIRPMGLLETAQGLGKISGDDLKQEVGIFAKPFKLLLEQIETDYAQFAVEKPKEAEPLLIIKKHYLLLNWYVEKGLETQAILLAREWIVTTLSILEQANYLERNGREPIEKQLNAMSHSQEYEQPISLHVQDAKKLADVWSKLSEYRNDIAHCEMRVESLSPDRLHKYAQELPSILKELFPKLNLDH